MKTEKIRRTPVEVQLFSGESRFLVFGAILYARTGGQAPRYGPSHFLVIFGGHRD